MSATGWLLEGLCNHCTGADGQGSRLNPALSPLRYAFSNNFSFVCCGGGGKHEHNVQAFLVILGAFAKFRKATVRFIMSVCPSVYPTAWNNSAPTGRNLVFGHFSKIC
jgi:hypothetical protein